MIRDDPHVLKNFPSIKEVVQPAVAYAMMVMKMIGEEYIGKPDMPPDALGLANAIVCGVWECDTFLGRKYEIEHCLAMDMQNTLAAGKPYLVCKYHKTAPTYGDVVKFLTPGLWKTLETYNQLPKPECIYFLVPVTPTAETISFPRNLKTFYSKFMKSKVWPTCNQWRKLFHNQLMKLTKDETALKDLMSQLDAHGRDVQDKHYLLRDPEDDLALARTLVEKIIGTTVPWPETSLEAELGQFLESIDIEIDTKATPEEMDEDEEPLEYWSFGAIFGIREIGGLNILPVADTKAADAMMPLLDDTSDTLGHDVPKVVVRGDEPSLEVSESIQTELYKQYPQEKLRPGTRNNVDASVHSYIMEHLRAWQRKHNKTEFERPSQTYWFWNLRIKLIQEGRLSKSHCEDFCRNSIRNKLARLQNA